MAASECEAALFQLKHELDSRRRTPSAQICWDTLAQVLSPLFEAGDHEGSGGMLEPS
jgi:hypothetical protein